ncbi:hypothetical protein LTS18_009663 [Coniosporium uncinatum]|uniref:Uncharacterized protein n=1 Tax=Coniosporium uncinatum TaxID=93489 RepID=A0ACC3D0J1_9PEZI|nr:hypothetical protein LTS18_009663 [Coniosporium uncinatum]
MPVAKAYAFLKEQVRSSENATTLASCERLIARHIFIPARSTFLGDSRKPDQTSLRSLLQPLHDAVSTSTAGSAALRPALLSLLDITIRSNTTPAYKASTSDTVWIQGVVAALAYCGGTPVDPDSNVPLTTVHLEFPTLEGILRTLKTYNVKLETSFLEWIAKLYCGLEFKDSALVQWPLVALVLDLDADVFIPKSTSAIEGVSKNLFTLIPPLDLNAATAAEAGALRQADVQLRYTIIDEILVPLMKAYAKRRDLPGFMSRWYEQLRDTKLCSTNSSPAVWLDPKLLLALRPLLEIHLTTTQIRRLLATYTDLVKSYDQQQPQSGSQSGSDDSAQRDCHASLILLDATLGAIEREKSVTELKDQLYDLQSTLWHLGEDKTFNGLSAPAARLRRLLGRLLDLTLPYRDADNLQQQAREHLSSACFTHTAETLTKHQDSSFVHRNTADNEALSFILHLCGSYARVNGIKDLVAEKLNSSMEKLSTDTHVMFENRLPTIASVEPRDAIKKVDMTWPNEDTLTVAIATLYHPALLP